MLLAFIIIAVLTLASAVAAMSLRNLVHCALCMVLTFCGIAATYLQLSAEFVGFAQILVYVGAVTILIVFAVMLTRNSDTNRALHLTASSWVIGFGVAALVCGSLIFSILNSAHTARALPPSASVSVKQIGEELMTKYVLPLEVIGLLLTAAMVGAVVISMREAERTMPEKNVSEDEVNDIAIPETVHPAPCFTPETIEPARIKSPEETGGIPA